MLEMYYKYRVDYKDFLLFIKVGSFYEVFDKDSLILNKLFGYKIKRIKDNIKVGFPLNRLDYIINVKIKTDKNIKVKSFNSRKLYYV